MPEYADAPIGQELSAEQRARIAITKASRDVLAERGFASSGRLSPYEVIALARYIETGDDPTDDDDPDQRVIVTIPDAIDPRAVAKGIDDILKRAGQI